LGSIGQRHVRNVRSILGDQVDLLAYRARGRNLVLSEKMTVRPDTSPEDAYGIRSFSRLDDALSEHPDAVFITNPNAFHLPVAMRAAQAGCHLFIEKPLSHTLDGIPELMRIVEQQRLIAFVAYQFRFHPGLRLVKSLIDEGRLGRVVAAHVVNGEYIPDWHPYEAYGDTHAARRDLGGGCVHIQTHEIDYAIWLFGMPRQVFAVGGRLSRLDVDVEDSVSMLLRCDQDGRPLPVHVHLDYLQRPPQRVCEVVGDAGRARYDYYEGRVDFDDIASRQREHHDFSAFDRNQMFLDELTHFLACLRGESTPLIDLREGARSVKLAVAAESSLRTNAAVELHDA
jgi:predicted dehydrogenase